MIGMDIKTRKAEYPELFEILSALLFKVDPIGINFETNFDEYESEVATIIPRLPHAKSAADVQLIVHEEFCRWFDDETVGSINNYNDLAFQIWAEWLRYR